jgi:hypothetical protein
MGFSSLEWFVLLTLILIAYWVISLYTQTYKPILVCSILLIIFGLGHYFTTPAEKQVLFGFSALFVIRSMEYISLGLGVLGILYIISVQRRK